MHKDKIEQYLSMFPEVSWDRWSGEDGDITIFGWIDRDDSYKDFCLINFTDNEPYEIYSSSAKYTDSFCGRLDFTHDQCKRVEDTFNVSNMIRLKKADMTKIKYPATQILHWPSGPVNACDEHAQGIKALGNFMGAHVISTKLDKPAECSNCVNESKGKDRVKDGKY